LTATNLVSDGEDKETAGGEVRLLPSGEKNLPELAGAFFEQRRKKFPVGGCNEV
jgi:hypothetical protein